MEATRFNSLLMGLKGSDNLDYHKAQKFYAAFAEIILNDELSLRHLQDLYAAIPLKLEDFHDCCRNKERLFDELSKKVLTEAQSEAVLDFLDDVMTDATEKAFLASFFLKQHYCYDGKSKYLLIHEGYREKFLPYLDGKSLSDDALEKLKTGFSSGISLELLELMCKLADEADQKGLGHLMKAIYVDTDDFGPWNPLENLEKSKAGRKLLKKLLLRLCDYEPVGYPKDEDYKKYGYDFRKRFSSGIIYTVKAMATEKAWLEESYADLQNKVVEVYLKGGGDFSFVAEQLYDMNWYLQRYAKCLQSLKKGHVVDKYNSFDACRLNGTPEMNFVEDFLEAFVNKTGESPREVLRLCMNCISRLPKEEGKTIFLKMCDLYLDAKETAWRNFADMLLLRDEYDSSAINAQKLSITKVSEVWEPIVCKVANLKVMSGKDFEYLSSICPNLDNNQRKRIAVTLTNIALIEKFEAWNKLYDVLKAYSVSYEAFDAKVQEKLKFIEMVDKF